MALDILMYISDQHSFAQQSYAGDSIIRTPNLDRIAAEGTAMMNAYTAYPLCVPARMSLMTGQQTSKCGVMTNMTALDSNRVTFAHCLDIAGYDTTLCGRMHFVGGDQRHGFKNRLVGDITPVYQNRPASIGEERGAHDRTPQGTLDALSLIGGGDSPVLEFDRAVVKAAVDYLDGTYDKPQFLCVGTYGPHHSYVAPRELYEYYYDKVEIPEDSFSYPEHPALEGRILHDDDPEVVRAVRAAYYGMVEFEDQLIGEVYDKFREYLERNNRQGIFVYVSDHGDQIGYRGYYGKSTFYDTSSHVPMVFSGAGVKAGVKIEGAVSLLDLAPTFLELAGAPSLPDADGVSLVPAITEGADDKDRMVMSELDGGMVTKDGRFYYGQMVKQGNYKYIHFDGLDEYDQFFDLSVDPDESTNVIDTHREKVEEMKRFLEGRAPEASLLKEKAEVFTKNLMLLMKCDLDNKAERWMCPEEGRHKPEPLVTSKLFAEFDKKRRLF